MKPIAISIVCHGNIARSQMLHHFLTRALSDLGVHARIFSCGTASKDAYPNDRRLLSEVRQELERLGLHVVVERTLWDRASAQEIENSDIILVADEKRRRDVLARTSADPSRVSLFYEYIGEGKKDFLDTFDRKKGKQDPRRFAECFQELDRIAGLAARRILISQDS